VGLAILAEWVVPMIFGQAFDQSATLCQIMLLGLPFFAAKLMFIQALNAFDRSLAIGWAEAFGLAAALAALFVLLPLLGIYKYLTLRYEKQIEKAMKKYKKWQDARNPPAPVEIDPSSPQAASRASTIDATTSEPERVSAPEASLVMEITPSGRPRPAPTSACRSRGPARGSRGSGRTRDPWRPTCSPARPRRPS
jgi:hypothetical protein